MRKCAALLLASAMVLSPVTVLADDDLEARVAALEERVAVLEAQLGLPESETPADDAGADPEELGDLVFDYGGCSLRYVSSEIRQDYQGKDALVAYFDFLNNSGKDQAAYLEFQVQAFQNGKTNAAIPILNPDIQEHMDSMAQVMSGTDPVRVAFIEPLSDTSDVVLRVSPLISFGDEHLDIPVSLK